MPCRGQNSKTMIRLFSRQVIQRGQHFYPQILARHFASGIESTKGAVQISAEPPAGSGQSEEYLHPDWYRTPQKSDGPRCIAPDYPDTPFQSYQTRSPYNKYYDQQRRRDFGELVNERYDILGAQNFDVETTYSMRYMLTSVGIATGLVIAVIQVLNYIDDKEGWRRDAAPREFPYLHKYQFPQPKEPHKG